MRMLLCFLLFSFSSLLFSQQNDIPNSPRSNSRKNKLTKNPVRYSDSLGRDPNKKTATLDLYRFIDIERDTTYIDTSLTIQKEYSHNYLRKDTFGLLAFPNEGQTYNTLQFGLTSTSLYPEFGFKAKHFNFLEAQDIRYASVATPVTELYFKSVMKRGQSVDSFFTLNLNPGLNLSIAYRGLRSEGKYINQLSSTGNFRFTTSYNTQNQRYIVNAHFTSQDILNEENGGITTNDDFESENVNFKNRERLEVYLTNAKSFLKGKRIFIDHFFKLNASKEVNNWYITHQFNYENKFFEYNQPTVNSRVGELSYNRFGDSYLNSGINNHTHYNKMYNNFGFVFENSHFGKFKVFVEDFRSNFYYRQILILENQTIPAALNQAINSFGGQYEYQKNKWQGKFLYAKSVTKESLSNFDAKMSYSLNEATQFNFVYQNQSKIPNNNYELFQSSYVSYNWFNDFRNEKINTIKANLASLWINADLQFSTINDYLYFRDTSVNALIQTVSPSQYKGTINYVSLKLNKELKFGKFALDNTFLFQKVEQKEAILNVPDIVTRNTLYYSGYLFKKAMYLQTGLVFNYFTNYFANDYNPIIGEFFIQNDKEIGNYPNLDFFINARVQRTRIYFKAEHFNSSLTGNMFYASPNNPYRDFMIRFGLVWNFFQ